jgi:hypothetical protein
MTTRPTAVVRAEELADLPPAAALLAQAQFADPHQRLLGSGTTLPADTAEFMPVLAYALKAGYVDLATHAAQLVGLACWITHLARRRPHQHDSRSRVGHLPGLGDQLDLFDHAYHVPTGRTHHHLAYLATRTGHPTHLITEQLLRHRGHAADEHRQTLYVEVHDGLTLARLRRGGYQPLRTSNGDPAAPQPGLPSSSVAMSRAAPRPGPVLATRRSWSSLPPPARLGPT